MDGLADKVIAGAAGGLLSSTITATVAYIVGVKQRRLTFELAERKDLEDFVNDAAEYIADAGRLVDFTHELHGMEIIDQEDWLACYRVALCKQNPTVGGKKSAREKARKRDIEIRFLGTRSS